MVHSDILCLSYAFRYLDFRFLLYVAFHLLSLAHFFPRFLFFFLKYPICYFLLFSVLFSWAILSPPLFKPFYKHHFIIKFLKGEEVKKKRGMFVIPGLTRTLHSFINKLWRISRLMIYISGNWHILCLCLLTQLSHWKYIRRNPKH